MGFLSGNPMWEAFGERAITTAVSGGADFGECLTTIQRVGAGNAGDWYREWMSTADRVAAIGDASAEKGHKVSAREAYLRAATYYHTAYGPLFGAPVDPRVVAAFEKETATFLKAAERFDPPIAAIEIPFENGTLPGYFITVDDSGTPRRTMIHTNGYDSNIQEMYFGHAPAAIRRGYNVLLFDGPGQGRNLIRDNMPIRPDWEDVVRPVIDYALTRPEIDPHQMILVGWSLGGILAPRAAGFEHRIAALVADPGMWDMRPAVVSMLPLSPEEKARFPDIDPALLQPLVDRLNSPEADPMLRWRLLQRGPWVHGVPTLFDALAALSQFEVSSVAGNITCPTLLTAAESDPLAAYVEKLYDALNVPKTLVRFTEAEGAGGHCEVLARTLYHQRVFDWLDETLGS